MHRGSGNEPATLVQYGGHVLIATPYNESTRATAIESWIGGHSQRGQHAGAAEPFLHKSLTEGANPHAVPGCVS